MAKVKENDPTPKGSAANRYSQGRSYREPFLTRARLNASLTDASLFTYDDIDVGGGAGGDLQHPWTSLGAYLINNISSKLVLALFPVGLSFVRFEASRKVLAGLLDLEETQRGEAKTAIAKGLSVVERELVLAVAADGDHTVQTLTARRLIVGGNHGQEQLPDGRIRGIPLDRYVTFRDKKGDLIEFVVEDPVAWETLPDDIKEMITAKGHSGMETPAKSHEKTIRIYTRGRRLDEAGRWEVYEEVWGEEVPGSRATFDKDAMPFSFLGINFLEGEHYSRAYVDSYISDLQMFDGLSEVVFEGSAAAALLFRLVRPGSSVSKKALAEARNGAVITGEKDDVHTLDANKQADFQAANNQKTEAAERLARAFLLNSTVQRQGDRVTREEIRFVAQELQDVLGGVYATLTTSWQAPYAEKKLRRLQQAGRVTKFPRDQVEVTILTGAAALGRNSELANLDAFVLGGQAQGAPPAPVNWSEYYARRAVLLGIDAEGLILTKDEVMAEQQQAQQAALVQGVAPEVVRQVGQGINQQAANQAAQEGAPAQ